MTSLETSVCLCRDCDLVLAFFTFFSPPGYFCIAKSCPDYFFQKYSRHCTPSPIQIKCVCFLSK